MTKAKIFLVCSLIFIHPDSSHCCGNEYFQHRSDIPVTKGRIQLKHLLFKNGMTLPYWYQGFGDDIKENIYPLISKIRSQANLPGDQYASLDWPDLQKALDKKVDYKVLSDYAWLELRIGNKKNAVKLLEALYSTYPNEYNVVANLGTAYEVTGNDEKALLLLKKAVFINPGSHHGSEWIHVNILEQKVRAKKDYSQILSLGADKNFTEWLSGNVYNKVISPDSLMIQIAYQLHERISFVPDPDPIVGQLVFDFADLVSLAHSVTEAKPFYRYAITYDSSLAKKEKERILIGEGKMTETEITGGAVKKPEAATSQWIYIGLITIAVGGIGFYFISRKRR